MGSIDYIRFLVASMVDGRKCRSNKGMQAYVITINGLLFMRGQDKDVVHRGWKLVYQDDNDINNVQDSSKF